MGFATMDIVPLTQARARLSELAYEVKAGSEKIITRNGESHVALVDAARLDVYHRLERDPPQMKLRVELTANRLSRVPRKPATARRFSLPGSPATSARPLADREGHPSL